MFTQSLLSLLDLLSSPLLLSLILLAVPLGMFFGAMPGLGGKLGIALLIPLVFGMEPTAGAVLLVAMHAVVHTGGSIPSILFGIPGTGPDAATVVDGYPLAQQGQAGRALGAMLAASAVGGVIGAVALGALLPVLQPVIFALGPTEFFLLAVLGITFIAALSGDSLNKGLLLGLFGLMLAFVGLDPQTGVPRFTVGQLWLWDGIDTITAVLAVFALPEVIALAVSAGPVAVPLREPARFDLASLLEGMREVCRHKWLTLRTSLIGVVIGMIPGLGGEAASWFCYGHAVQTSKTPERFGKGAIEGVIAPETANNSKEGGALLPTLFFGVPGSSGMALLLGAFVTLGLQPGPQMLTTGLGLVWTLVWTLVLANLLAVVLFLLCWQPFGWLVFVRGGLLAPLVLVFILLGSVISAHGGEALLLLAGLGLLGYGLKCYGWPRAPFMVGLVLGTVAEDALHKALIIWGPWFWLRPVSLLLIVVIMASLGLYLYRRRSLRVALPLAATDQDGTGWLGVLVALVMLVLFAVMVAVALGYPPTARLLPLVIGIPGVVLALVQLVLEWRAWRATPGRTWQVWQLRRRLVVLGWVALFIVGVLCGGFLWATPLLVLAFLRLDQRLRLRVALALAAGCWGLVYGVFERLLGLPLFGGWLLA